MLVGVSIERFSCSKVVHYQRDLCGLSYNSRTQYDGVLQGYIGSGEEAKGQSYMKKEKETLMSCVHNNYLLSSLAHSERKLKANPAVKSLDSASVVDVAAAW
mmetsp:Transcript_1199/g.1835  ORF Transcript_1199/g.1835 Transcript_1199/m.1835 type:complete len:102 (-) Transcript_1199:135-440(-)